MLTLFHAPASRSSRIVQLIIELGIEDRVDIKIVSIPGREIPGTPPSPHPEGKVPLLMDGQTVIRETNAIMLYLTDMFPDGGMGPAVGDPDRGAYLSWLAWYGNVLELVLICQFANLQHPLLDKTFRGMDAAVEVLAKALERGPYLMGEAFTAADLLMVSPFGWAPEHTPDHAGIKAWIARCTSRPSFSRTQDIDAGHMKAIA